MKTRTDALVSPNKNARAILLEFFEEHPTRSAVIIFIAYLIVSTLFGLTAKSFFPQSQPEFVALIGLALVVAVVLSALGWWKAAGFNFPSEWRDAHLMWIPFIVV